MNKIKRKGEVVLGGFGLFALGLTKGPILGSDYYNLRPGWISSGRPDIDLIGVEYKKVIKRQ